MLEVRWRACLQKTPVPHFRSNQMRLVAVCFLHNALDILRVEDLVEVELAYVLCQPFLEDMQNLLTASLSPIH